MTNLHELFKCEFCKAEYPKIYHNGGCRECRFIKSKLSDLKFTGKYIYSNLLIFITYEEDNKQCIYQYRLVRLFNVNELVGFCKISPRNKKLLHFYSIDNKHIIEAEIIHCKD